MRAAVFVKPRRIEVTDRLDPVIREPTDAIVRVALACVCGSDPWYYRGKSPFEQRRAIKSLLRIGAV